MSSICLLTLQEALRDQQVVLTQTHSKSLLLPWVPEHVRFCVGPLRVESLISHSPLALLKASPAGHQSQTLWGFVFPVQDPWAGDPNVGLGPLTPWGEFLQL